MHSFKNRINSSFNKFIFRNGLKRNSPKWAFMEGFTIPDLVDPSKTYLARIRIIQTPWFGVYLHKMSTPDGRPILHNHPWPFVSFLLKGSYTEMIPCNCNWDGCTYYAVPRRVNRMNVKRFNKSWHWISELHREVVWTLVFVGKRRRTWGYLEPDGTYYDYNNHPVNDEIDAALASRGGGGVV